MFCLKYFERNLTSFSEISPARIHPRQIVEFRGADVVSGNMKGESVILFIIKALVNDRDMVGYGYGLRGKKGIFRTRNCQRLFRNDVQNRVIQHEHHVLHIMQ